MHDPSPFLGGESRLPEQASPESRTLGQATNLLRKSISPNDIVAVLFDTKLLTEDDRDLANASHLTPRERMDEVYLALERRVRVLPEPFHKFVRILIGVPALKPVAKQLYDLYLKEGGTRQEYAAQLEATVQPTPGNSTSSLVLLTHLHCSTAYRGSFASPCSYVHCR